LVFYLLYEKFGASAASASISGGTSSRFWEAPGSVSSGFISEAKAGAPANGPAKPGGGGCGCGGLG
jgi:hypothetical protein